MNKEKQNNPTPSTYPSGRKELGVKLLDYGGGDKTHSLAAWQSTYRELGVDMPKEVKGRIDLMFDYLAKKKKKSPQQLLEYLQTNRHTSPFEHSWLMFGEMEVDIATHIQFIKHRIGVSINTESARYKELKDKWYLPFDWKTTQPNPHTGIPQTTSQKEGDEVLLKWLERLEEHSKRGHELYHKALKELTPILGRKRAKESSRYFLGYNKILCSSLSCNFSSFMHLQNLRNSPHAQKEIQTVAKMMLEEVRKVGVFELSLRAFGY